MLLNYKNVITILDRGGCLNTYFETKRSDGNDEQNKLVDIFYSMLSQFCCQSDFLKSMAVKPVRTQEMCIIRFSSFEKLLKEHDRVHVSLERDISV